MSEKMIKIGNWISDSRSTLIIAELSANHNQNFKLAVETLKAIKEAGANAVKLQTYTADTLTIDCDNDYFKINRGTIWDGQTLYQLYKKAYTPWNWQPKLKDYAEDLGLICFSSPFNRTAVDFLENINVPAYKIASLEITDIPLIEYVASKGKPIIISTGIALRNDIEEAINACKRQGNEKIILLKCTTAYPTPLDEVNLKTMVTISKTFGYPVGLSDHTLGISVPIAAVALGAQVVEKHFILDRKNGGPDAMFSLEPHEFKYMVKSIREVEKAIGKSKYELSDKAKMSRKNRRSLFVIKNINKNEIITEDNVRSIRPGYGLHPKFLKNILGGRANRNLSKGTPFESKFIDVKSMK